MHKRSFAKGATSAAAAASSLSSLPHVSSLAHFYTHTHALKKTLIHVKNSGPLLGNRFQQKSLALHLLQSPVLAERRGEWRGEVGLSAAGGSQRLHLEKEYTYLFYFIKKKGQKRKESKRQGQNKNLLKVCLQEGEKKTPLLPLLTETPGCKKPKIDNKRGKCERGFSLHCSERKKKCSEKRTVSGDQ